MIRIVLTAAIRPQSDYRLNLTDPTERSRQYSEALLKWCDWAQAEGDATIVFIENSGADLEAFANDALGTIPDLLHLVSAPTPPMDIVSLGKGASESLMLDLFAAKYSDDSDDTIWLKTTGRLYVTNLSKILPKTLTEDSILGRLSLDLQHADARLFGASAKNWKRFFRDMGDDVDESRDRRLEHVLARRLCMGVGSGADLQRFLGQPQIEGVSGTWAGRDYGSVRSSVKRELVRVLDFALREKLSNKHF